MKRLHIRPVAGTHCGRKRDQISWQATCPLQPGRHKTKILHGRTQTETHTHTHNKKKEHSEADGNTRSNLAGFKKLAFAKEGSGVEYTVCGHFSGLMATSACKTIIV